MKKGTFINIIISLVTTALCVILLLLVATRLVKSQKKNQEKKQENKEDLQYYTSLDWADKDINDIPSQRNASFNNNVKGASDVYTVKINSQGLRDYEYGLEKPENSIRIAAVGDSTTYGEGVNLEDTYIKQLEKILNNHCNKKVEILNFGASGASTINELELIERKVLLYKPDIIMLQMDSNDSQVIHQIRDVDPFLNGIILKLKDSHFEVGQWLKQKLEFYKYYQYRKQLTPDEEYNNVIKPLETIKNISEENNIKLIIVSYDEPYHPFYYPKVLQYIKEHDIPLLDLSITKFGELSYKEKYLNPELDKNNFNFPIDSHPGKYGGQIMAEEISKFLGNIDTLEFKNLCFFTNK